jgi:hypothetical protein
MALGSDPEHQDHLTPWLGLSILHAAPPCASHGLVSRAPKGQNWLTHPQARRRNCSDFVKIEKGLSPDGRTALVRFDRGNGVNALSPEAIRQLTDAARSFEEDADTSVVILTGNAKALARVLT